MALRNAGHELLLRLIATEVLLIQRTIYLQCCERVKVYFSDLLSGHQLPASSTSKCHFFGIPLTSDILLEWTCFGLVHSDEHIRNSAAIMLSLTLRSRSLFSASYWQRVCLPIVLPVMPMLTCFADKDAQLGRIIMDFYDPDNSTLCPIIELFRGNVRLMFAKDSRIRIEAIARLQYLLLAQKDAQKMLPNIRNVTDVTPNTICLLDKMVDVRRLDGMNGIYDASKMLSLLQLLSSDSVEPAVRKATLVQLNVMAQDVALAELFHNENGAMLLVLDALRGALMVSVGFYHFY